MNAKPTVVSDLDVYHGYSSYLQIHANAALYNPSNVTLIIQGQTVAFGLRFNGQQIVSFLNLFSSLSFALIFGYFFFS